MLCVWGNQNSLSGESLLDHKLIIINKDLTDILYSSKCLEYQTFCASLSLLTDQKVQNEIAPFSSANSAHSCRKCYSSIHAKMSALSHIRRSSFLKALLCGTSNENYIKYVYKNP